jgi:hypothetical protein
MGLERFWRAVHGWAPKEAAEMLAAARLDRQASFARTLERYREPFPAEEAEALLILGYVTLRSLCEGVLKLFCAVWWEDYRKEPEVPKNKAGVPKVPSGLTFDPLIGFYFKRIDSQFEGFLRRVQTRGNAIHHFKDAKVGTQGELLSDIAEFLQFLLAVNSQLPYPDDIYDAAKA